MRDLADMDILCIGGERNLRQQPLRGATAGALLCPVPPERGSNARGLKHDDAAIGKDDPQTYATTKYRVS